MTEPLHSYPVHWMNAEQRQVAAYLGPGHSIVASTFTVAILYYSARKLTISNQAQITRVTSVDQNQRITTNAKAPSTM